MSLSETPPIQKKVCLIGSFGVGKTSLAARFVRGIFSDKYLTTIGVKIDRRIVDLAGQRVHLLVWDLAGEDVFEQLNLTYVRGAAGLVFVADVTRRETLAKCCELRQRIEVAIGRLPAVLLFNKSDLVEQSVLSDVEIADATNAGWVCFRTSAKTGQDVEAAFQRLAEALVGA